MSATPLDSQTATTAAQKRKQRSPFYTRVRKDNVKAALGAPKPWEFAKIIRTETGTRREREYFATLKEAKAAQSAAQLLNIAEGSRAGEISTQLRVEAIKAAEILAGRGNLIEAAEYFVAHALAGSNLKIAELVEQYLAFQKSEGAAPSYQSSINWRLRRFADFFKKKVANEITLRDIDRYLSTGFIRRGKKGNVVHKDSKPRVLNPTGRKIEIRNLRPMFNWAADMKIVKASPFPAKSFHGRKSKDAHNSPRPRVLTIDETKDVLAKAGELLPHIAIGLFAGLRPDETKALNWEDINFEQKRIIVNANEATSHSRREVSMPDNLVSLLSSVRQPGGPVSPAKFYRPRLNKLAIATSLSPWPKDVLRHSFASYWLAKNGDESRLKTLMGHHQASNVLRAHYIDVVANKDAEAYWGIVK